MVYEEGASVAILILASSLAFFGFKIHQNAIDFDIRYRSQLEQVKRKLSARFKRKTVDLLAFIVTDGTDEFDKPVKSLNDLQVRATRLDLPDKINELSKILADIQETKTTYSKIRALKKRMESRFFILSIIVGINAILPFLDVPELGTVANASQGLFMLILLGDFLTLFMFLDMYSAYKGYTEKEEQFLQKLDDVEVDSGNIIETTSSIYDNNDDN